MSTGKMDPNTIQSLTNECAELHEVKEDDVELHAGRSPLDESAPEGIRDRVVGQELDRALIEADQRKCRVSRTGIDIEHITRRSAPAGCTIVPSGEGTTCSFKRATDEFKRDRDTFAITEAIGQEMQGPARLAGRRFAAP